MSTVTRATDEVHNAILRDLRARIPGAQIKELPRPRDLWGCFADQYLGEWMAVASSAEAAGGDQASFNGPVSWSLDRRTQFDGHVHVRGTVRFEVERADEQAARRAATEVGTIAEQLAGVGEVHEVLIVREPDTEGLNGSTLHLMLLAHVESHYRNEIRMDERGVPWLRDTQIKVREIVLDYLCYGWSVLHIFHQHYNSPPLVKINAALAYFDNHRAAVLKEIDGADRYAEEMFKKMGQPPSIEKLLAARKK